MEKIETPYEPNEQFTFAISTTSKDVTTDTSASNMGVYQTKRPKARSSGFKRLSTNIKERCQFATLICLKRSRHRPFHREHHRNVAASPPHRPKSERPNERNKKLYSDYSNPKMKCNDKREKRPLYENYEIRSVKSRRIVNYAS